jgi:hypothetical protein
MGLVFGTGLVLSILSLPLLLYLGERMIRYSNRMYANYTYPFILQRSFTGFTLIDSMCFGISIFLPFLAGLVSFCMSEGSFGVWPVFAGVFVYMLL